MARPLTQNVIEQWVALVPSGSKFIVRDIWNEIGIETPEGRQHLRVILSRIAAQGLVVPDGGPGIYRKVDSTAAIIDWQEADITNTVKLVFPFELENIAKIYPKSIIVVAGSKNAGKTAFLYNFIAMNMDYFTIDLYNSETGREQMKERFTPLDIPMPAPFKVYERYDRFADVIHPEHISVIDYMDTENEAYLVGTEINAVFRKITTGVGVIALQKPPPSVTWIRGVKKIIDRDLAYGGGYSAKRAVLYISMSDNKLKLIYVKTPAQPKVHPANMTWTFQIADDGIHFTKVQRYYGDED